MSTDSQNDLAAKPPEPDSTSQKMDHSETNQLNGPGSAIHIGKRAQPDCMDSNGEPEAKKAKVNSNDADLTSMKIQESTRNGEMDNVAENSNSKDQNSQLDYVPSQEIVSLEKDKQIVDKHIFEKEMNSPSVEMEIDSPTVDKKTDSATVDKETVKSKNIEMDTKDVTTSQTVGNIEIQANIVTHNNSKEVESEICRTEIKGDSQNEDSSLKHDNLEKQNISKMKNESKSVNEVEAMDTIEKAEKGEQKIDQRTTKSGDNFSEDSQKPSKSKISITSDLPKDDLIRKLQEELRNEEAKLLLLKKLRQSQLQPIPTPKDHHAMVNQQQQQQPQQPHSQHHPQSHHLSKVTSQGSRNPNIPPPLVHGKNLYKAHPQAMPQLMRGGQMKPNRVHSGPPPLVMTSNRGSLQSLQVPQYQVRNQQLPVSISSSHGHLRQSQSQSYSSHLVSNSTQNMENQSPASRQAAAKLALRKQLEKTLLQIPPPKPPPPELHFLPSAANNEFIYLVGLEEVVNCILENNKSSKERTPSKFIQPFQCAQCKSFFTTIWKHDTKNGIMCESCIVSNQKKALKAEHTNRLKTAFVKALQQEQEIEQRMQNQNATNMQQAHSHHQRSQQRIMNPAPTAHRPVQPINYAYIPQMIQKPSHVGDRQREYLLDMIPPKGLNQTAGMVWK